MRVITTIPPYAPFLDKLASMPVITGVRLNTVMPIKGELSDFLVNLKKTMGEKDIWIDLKCRQIRTSHGFFFKAPESGIRHYKIDGKDVVLDPSDPRTLGTLRTPPWAELKIDRKIKLDLSKGPVKCWFQDGYDQAYIAEVVDGDTLIMLDGPKRVVGGGESINILDPSLEIEGYFTDLDLKWIEAAKKANIHTYMLSYVEQDSDIDDLLKLDPDAIAVAKIESVKGVEWAKNSYIKYSKHLRLMAARGDLYVEVGMPRPEKILKALYKIIKADKTAILASRILTSLREKHRPTCSDITDIACMIQMGYKNFMVGDDICFNEDSLMLALEILTAIGKEYS
jgi:pyruvate kinase